MKKCIFWDDEDNKFLTWDEVEFEKLKNEEVMVWKQIDPITKECRLFESFDDTELKDINGKSIYADSSIVEYGIQKWKVIYNVFQMSYELECVSNKSLSNMRLTGAYQNQLKIIDTIQENKLGLIKNDS